MKKNIHVIAALLFSITLYILLVFLSYARVYFWNKKGWAGVAIVTPFTDRSWSVIYADKDVTHLTPLRFVYNKYVLYTEVSHLVLQLPE